MCKRVRRDWHFQIEINERTEKKQLYKKHTAHRFAVCVSANVNVNVNVLCISFASAFFVCSVLSFVIYLFFSFVIKDVNIVSIYTHNYYWIVVKREHLHLFWEEEEEERNVL